MSELLIQAQDLNTYYGASHILRGVNFTVGRGETIGLMGRNGMGKTTTVHSIMGIVRPSAGSIVFGEQQLRGFAPYRVAQAGIGFGVFSTSTRHIRQLAAIGSFS